MPLARKPTSLCTSPHWTSAREIVVFESRTRVTAEPHGPRMMPRGSGRVMPAPSPSQSVPTSIQEPLTVDAVNVSAKKPAGGRTADDGLEQLPRRHTPPRDATLCVNIQQDLGDRQHKPAIKRQHRANACAVTGSRHRSRRYDQPIARVIFLKSKQRGIATLPFARIKVSCQFAQTGLRIFDRPKGRAA